MQAQGKGLCIYRTQATYTCAHKTLHEEKENREGEQEEGEQEPFRVVGHVTLFAHPFGKLLLTEQLYTKMRIMSHYPATPLNNTSSMPPMLCSIILHFRTACRRIHGCWINHLVWKSANYSPINVRLNCRVNKYNSIMQGIDYDWIEESARFTMRLTVRLVEPVCCSSIIEFDTAYKVNT